MNQSNLWFRIAGSVTSLLVGLLLNSMRVEAQPLGVVQDNPDGPAYFAGQVLIQFGADVTDAQLDNIVRRGGLNVIKHLGSEHGKAGQAPGLVQMWTGLPARQAVQILKNLPGVDFVEPNWLYTHQSFPNDPSFGNGSLWGMYGDASTPQNQYGSQAAEAWNAGFTGSKNVYVGIIDEGFQFTHPDLAANVWTNPNDTLDSIDNDGNGFADDTHGWDFFEDNNSIYDGTGDDHGTHVAGTIGAAGNNGIGVAGVNWAVTLISGKFLGPNGGSTADAVAAVNYFTDLKKNHGINVVALNNSWGGGGFSASTAGRHCERGEAEHSLCGCRRQRGSVGSRD